MRNSFMLQPSISRCSFFMCCIIDKDHIEQFVVGSGTRKYSTSPLAACLHHTPFIVFSPLWLDDWILNHLPSFGLPVPY